MITSGKLAAEELLALLVENLRDYAVIIMGPEGTVLDWQGGAERIVGHSAPEAMGQSADIIFTPEDRAAGVLLKELSKAASTGRADDRRWHLKRDGSRFFADGVVTALYDDGGALRGFGKVFRDATAEWQAIEALRGSEARLQLALRAGRMGMWDLDLARRHLLCSDACKANYGRQPGDVLTYDDLVEGVLPEERDEWNRLVAAAIEGEELDHEHRTRWPDGTIHWVHVRASTIHDANGVAVALSGISLNVDERKSAEHQLRLLDSLGEETRTALDPSTVMRVTTRRLGEHLRVSRCVYADLDPDNDRFTIREDWVADGVSSVAGVYSLDLFGARVAADMRQGRMLVVSNVDLELTSLEGGDTFRSIDVQAIVCCPLVKDGRLVAMMAVHHREPREWLLQELALIQEIVDRSWAHVERVRAADTLRAQDRRKDEFLATLAHELRNPLAPVRTGLEVLKRSPTGPDAERARETMDRQLSHMVRLIDDLLDVSRINLGKVELKREPLEVRAVFDHAVEATRPLIETAGHALTVHLPTQAIWVDGDLTRLAQAIGNLLTNAAKYTPQPGRIDLSAEVLGEEVVIRVTDDGLGLADDMQEAVFDLFAQVDHSLHRAQGGLGIGLALVRKLIAMHGGTIEAKSPGLGLGSTFVVHLPVGRPKEALSAAPTGRPAPASPSTSRRVLVVDDNEDGAEMLATMLSLAGHDTRTAHDGPAALEMASSFLPEVVFLDIGLPGMSGYEVAEALRADARLADITLVALTGWGGDDDKRKSQEAGFDVHLTKPVDGAAVEEVLRNPAPRRSPP